ncbi:Uncharacterized protein LOCC1_G003218 [Lachnellula occidentalis]|uniref:Transcriptional regulator n=1 Tax=Lachnellula occidentalis TaxID=215460 RepID=A0A8H8UEN1_9HELO|nr:Uncharacterized protein LOCC1_G003218 [Lachnellula occidentalis]
MYLRTAHAEFHLPTLYKFIQSHPLGILTTAIKSPIHPLIQSSHIPWVLDLPPAPANNANPQNANGHPTPIGTLRGHIARANPQAKAMIESLTSSSDTETTGIKRTVLEEEVLILFNHPVHAYVTPKFYTETKPSTGKVVSTWNYAAVQVYGKATVIHDSTSDDLQEFLGKQLDDLARIGEEDIMGYTGTGGRKTPWKVSEAPESYSGVLKKAIIGVEIEVVRMEGKFKLSQELRDGDREGTVEGFRALGTEEGERMAEMIEERDEVKRGEKGHSSGGS